MRRFGSAYEDVRARIADLVKDLDGSASTTTLPACPEWSVHDVIAHLTGVCACVLSGDINGAATAPWTAAQVEARKDRTMAEIVREWDDVGPKVAAMADDFPGRYGAQLVADIALHEQDIRGALGRPGARDNEAVAIGLDFLVTTFLHAALVASGLGPLEVRAGEERWVVGTGDPPTGDIEAAVASALLDPKEVGRSPRKDPVATVTVEPFELFRAIPGRRSAGQIFSFGWSVDPEPYITAFAIDHFSLRTADLEE